MMIGPLVKTGNGLASTAYKELAVIIFDRLSSVRKDRTRNLQASFRCRRDCIGHEFILRQIFEHRLIFRRLTISPLCPKTAFNSPDRAVLWRSLSSEFVREINFTFEFSAF